MLELFSGPAKDDISARKRATFVAGLYLNNLIKGGVVEPIWLDGGTSLIFSQLVDGKREFTHLETSSGKMRQLFDVSAVSANISAVSGQAANVEGLPFDYVIPLGNDLFQVTYANSNYVVNASTSEVTVAVGEGPLEAMAPNSETNRRRPRFFDKPLNLVGTMPVLESGSPDGRWFAFLREKNVWLRSTLDNRERQVTKDGGDETDWDIESQRQIVGPDMSITIAPRSGWSPNSAKLFAIKSDRSGVFKIPSVHFLKRFEEADFINYPKAGAQIERTVPYVIDVLADRLIPIRVDRSDEQYLLFCEWLPCSRELLFMRIDRTFKTIEVFRADSISGEARSIVKHTSQTFVRLQHEYIYAGITDLTLLPDGSGFLLISDHEGWRHIYHYDLDGNLVRKITSGEFPVAKIYAIDQKNDRVLFWAQHDQQRPYDLHVCSVPLTGGNITRLTDLPGQHRAIFSPDHSCFLDIHSSVARPVRTDLRKIDGSLVATLSTADVSQMNAFNMPSPEEFCVKAADGETDLWGVLYKPFDFDPSQSYPVVEYIYGGPNLSLPRRNFEAPYGTFSNHIRAMAHLGFVTLVVDGRGTPQRSKAFHDVVYGNWGKHEIADHKAVLEQLAERHAWFDISRVGIYGHSWGGHFATRALIDAPEVYKVAVASAPGYDPYDANIYEPYIGQPQDVRQAYDFANPIAHASRIKGNLMIIAGSSDHGVYSSVMKMVHQLVEAGIDHDLVILPGQGHGYLGNSNDYALRRLTTHFCKHLGVEV